MVSETVSVTCGKRLMIAPLAALPALARTLPADAHAIGLLGPDMAHPPLPLSDRQRLKLAFHDIAAPRPGLRAASAEQARRLVTFARAWARSPSSLLLLYCWMGVSRSPAAAFIAQCALRPEADELALARQLRTLAPFATPNARLVALADAELERGGRMRAAVRAIGRGAHTDSGRPFVWPVSDT